MMVKMNNIQLLVILVLAILIMSYIMIISLIDKINNKTKIIKKNVSINHCQMTGNRIEWPCQGPIFEELRKGCMCDHCKQARL